MVLLVQTHFLFCVIHLACCAMYKAQCRIKSCSSEDRFLVPSNSYKQIRTIPFQFKGTQEIHPT